MHRDLEEGREGRGRFWRGFGGVGSESDARPETQG